MSSGARKAFSPHDLLWICRNVLQPAGQGDKPAPTWVASGDGPVVVRRAESSPGWVPVGVRGLKRAERFAAFAPERAVERSLSPFDIRAQESWLSHPDRDRNPVLRTLSCVSSILDNAELDWGITGSLGYELATGYSQLRLESDLDLLIDCPAPMSKEIACKLMTKLDGHACRVDVQLETSQGAIALSEWARPSGKVLIKTSRGPRLTESPWCTSNDV